MSIRPKIFGAIILGISLIGGAFMLSEKQSAVTHEAEVTEAHEIIVREYINILDENNNQIPDWQEEFVTSSVDFDATASSSDYQRPTTLTGQFSIELAEDIMSANMFGEMGDTPEAIVEKATLRLHEEAQDELYTKKDIIIHTDNSQNALRAYGNSIATISLQNQIQEAVENEMVLLEQLVTFEDESVLPKFDLLIASYQGILDDFLKNPTPSNFTNEHLFLVNVTNALLQDIKAFRYTNDDPLPSMLRLQRYPLDSEGLYTAVSNIYLKLDEAGIEWTESDATSGFIKVEER